MPQRAFLTKEKYHDADFYLTAKPPQVVHSVNDDDIQPEYYLQEPNGRVSPIKSDWDTTYKVTFDRGSGHKKMETKRPTLWRSSSAPLSPKMDTRKQSSTRPRSSNYVSALVEPYYHQSRHHRPVHDLPHDPRDWQRSRPKTPAPRPPWDNNWNKGDDKRATNRSTHSRDHRRPSTNSQDHRSTRSRDRDRRSSDNRDSRNRRHRDDYSPRNHRSPRSRDRDHHRTRSRRSSTRSYSPIDRRPSRSRYHDRPRTARRDHILYSDDDDYSPRNHRSSSSRDRPMSHRSSARASSARSLYSRDRPTSRRSSARPSSYRLSARPSSSKRSLTPEPGRKSAFKPSRASSQPSSGKKKSSFLSFF